MLQCVILQHQRRIEPFELGFELLYTPLQLLLQRSKFERTLRDISVVPSERETSAVVDSLRLS